MTMHGETPEEVILEHDEGCKETIQVMRREMAKVRTGRASTGLVEGITVDYYGAKTPLNGLAQISAPEPRLIVIQVYDSGAVSAVEKAIQTSDLGFNPATDGNTIRINVPALTEERRKELTKHLHKMAEDFRISIRNHRRDANELIKKLEKDSGVSKDEGKRAQDEVQKLTDSYVKQVDEVLASKEQEILEV